MCLFGKKIEFFYYREHTQNLVVPPNPCPIQPRSPLNNPMIVKSYQGSIPSLSICIKQKVVVGKKFLIGPNFLGGGA